MLFVAVPVIDHHAICFAVIRVRIDVAPVRTAQNLAGSIRFSLGRVRDTQ